MVSRGRGIKMIKDHNNEFLTDSEKLVIWILETSPMTFTGMFNKLKEKKETKLSSRTLAARLKTLGKKGYVTKSESDPRIYMLTSKAMDPVGKTMRNLNAISPLIHLDTKTGKALLTEDIINSVRKVSTLGWRGTIEGWETIEARVMELKRMETEVWGGYEKIPSFLKKRYEEPRPLTEHMLLKALARHNIERGGRKISHLSIPCGTPPELTTQEGFKKFYEKNADNPGLFPATAILKKDGTVENFDELLEWVKPLLEPPYLSYSETRRKFKGVIAIADNLASQVFAHEEEAYLAELAGAWVMEFLDPESRKRSEEYEKRLAKSLATASKRLRKSSSSITGRKAKEKEVNDNESTIHHTRTDVG